MKKTDSALGMGQKITRHDLIHDSSLLALGVSLGLGSNVGSADSAASYYPPTLTGLRGSHPGSFEGAMPNRKVGAHRRVLATDDMAYKQQIDAKRLDPLNMHGHPTTSGAVLGHPRIEGNDV